MHSITNKLVVFLFILSSLRLDELQIGIFESIHLVNVCLKFLVYGNPFFICNIVGLHEDLSRNQSALLKT